MTKATVKTHSFKEENIKYAVIKGRATKPGQTGISSALRYGAVDQHDSWFFLAHYQLTPFISQETHLRSFALEDCLPSLRNWHVLEVFFILSFSTGWHFIEGYSCFTMSRSFFFQRKDKILGTLAAPQALSSLQRKRVHWHSRVVHGLQKVRWY